MSRRPRSHARLAADAAVTAAELVVAAPQVISARLTMFASPSAEANAEAMLMVTEKAQAFAEAGVAASVRAAQMTAQTAAYLTQEAASVGGHPGAAAGRLFDYWTGMARLGLKMQAAALEPLHKTATANARRLSR